MNGQDGKDDGDRKQDWEGAEDRNGRDDRETREPRAFEWWRLHGYSSREEALEAILRPQKRREPPDIELPEGRVPERPDRLRRRDHQLNLKLTRDEYDVLAEAAADYGVAPSTMARMLVNRGALAVFESSESRREPAGDG